MKNITKNQNNGKLYFIKSYPVRSCKISVRVLSNLKKLTNKEPTKSGPIFTRY